MNGLTMRSSKKSKTIWKQMKMNTQQPKTYGLNEGHPERKFLAIQTYLKKIEKSQINNLTLHLPEQEEQQQTKPRVSRRKEIRSE